MKKGRRKKEGKLAKVKVRERKRMKWEGERE